MSKPFRCPACGSALIARVRRHMLDRVISLAGFYPFVCRSCARRFRARRQRHLLISARAN